jgi:hypothetical protein
LFFVLAATIGSLFIVALCSAYLRAHGGP